MGRFKLFIGAVVVLMLVGAGALADGKVFTGDYVSPTIPFQRALIIYDEVDQTLILQSRYQLQADESIPDVGWVVPLPAVPRLASMDPGEANKMFDSLMRETRPQVIRVSPAIAIFLVVLFGVSLIAWIYTVIRFKSPGAERIRSVSFQLMVICCFILLTFGLFAPALQRARGEGMDVAAEVRVLHDERVGVYEVKVIEADTPADVIAWLNEHDFEFGDEDAAAFQDYIDREWVFVVANIAADAELEDVVSTQHHWQTMTAPLIMRFETSAPVYPLALTGTGGHNTEVILYTLARHRIDSNGRIEMQYANSTSLDIIEKLREHVEPAGIFDGLDVDNLNYLCRFRENLVPEGMAEDIVFERAATNRPYGHREIRW